MRSFALSRTSLERFLTHSHSNNKEKDKNDNNNSSSSNNNNAAVHKKRDSHPLPTASLSKEARNNRALSSASAPPVTTISTATASAVTPPSPTGGLRGKSKHQATKSAPEHKQSIFAAFLAKMPTGSKKSSRHNNSPPQTGTNEAGSASSSTAAAPPPHLTLEARAAALKDAKAILATVKNDWQFRPKTSSSTASKRKSISAEVPPPSQDDQEQLEKESRTSSETTPSISSAPTSPSTAPTTTENTPQKPARENPVTAEPSRNRSLEETIQRIEADIDGEDSQEHIRDGYDNDEEDGNENDEDENAEWRDREESDSDASAPQSLMPKQAPVDKQKSGVIVYADDGVKSPYRFDDPDSVGAKLTLAERRERRAKAQRDEVEWNEGLRNWVEQRDVWTRADKDGRIKVAKSKFEDNPLRRLVQPDQYPQIYSRVIIRAAEPPIPINLKDLTAALVLGWKADNQWPPKPQAPEPMFAKRRPNSGSSIGDTMLRKVLGFR